MRRLITCSDGTWQSAESKTRTNVYYLAKAIPPIGSDGVRQLVLYDPGVGVGSLADRITGGAFGRGLDDNIKDVYKFIIDNYRDGDRIYVLGFSRGAYTARSAVGLIRKCGILKRQNVNRIDEAYELYRRRDDDVDSPEATTFRSSYSWAERRLAFLGVWDTVGSLGIPLLGLRLLTRKKYQFHDTVLSRIVDHACHAVAIDERRGTFVPTLWDEKVRPDQIVEQTWFPGVHSDIGGGYNDRGLADITLAWMAARAEAAGLTLDFDYVLKTLELALPHSKELDERRFRSIIHNSLTGLYVLLHRRRRTIGEKAERVEDVWHTAKRRFEDLQLRYRPKSLQAYFARPDCRVAGHDVLGRTGPGVLASDTGRDSVVTV